MASIMSRINFSRKPNSKVYNHNPSGFGFFAKNPGDPDVKLEPSHRSSKASYAPSIKQPHHRSSLANVSVHSGSSFTSNKHERDLCVSGGLEDQSVMDLENYALHKAEETTQAINSCLKVTEEMREGASRVLVNLHQHGEQILRTHQAATSIDHNLRRGEKLLGSLGGLFSKKWKPKTNRGIKGPVLTDDPFLRRCNNTEVRLKLGSTPPRSQWNPRRFRAEPSSTIERVELEMAKQDDSLSDLSNLLGKLKAMAVDMGLEIDRQNKALDVMHYDVDELNIRMKGANHRARHLLRR
ncbi:hypothetical protein KSP40_PGU014977 [Platanthera guangdongensis]|uniref:t-SNARE coiled-coil homology domain-containing protein n=1 Tax=Platanthera guangdongensis TaxID=2320717 RepID=A0ABR2LWC6_9ASPA